MPCTSDCLICECLWHLRARTVAATRVLASAHGNPQVAATLTHRLAGPAGVWPGDDAWVYVHPVGYFVVGTPLDLQALRVTARMFRKFTAVRTLHDEVARRVGPVPALPRYGVRATFLGNVLIQVRDLFALASISSHAKGVLWKICRRYLRQAHDREDALYEFLHFELSGLCARWDRNSPFLPFLAKAFKNHCIDHARRLKRQGGDQTILPGVDPSSNLVHGPDDGALLAPLRRALDRAVEDLTPAQRRILELRHSAGLTYEAIVGVWYPADPERDEREMKQRANSLHQCHWRARQNLLDTLGEQLGSRESAEQMFDLIMTWYYQSPSEVDPS
jgi:RNA polymerase sigma factor (sigma-70 family)